MLRIPFTTWNCCIGFWMLWLCGWNVPIASAQVNRGEIPNTTYWLAMNSYYDGDFATAKKGFQEAAKSGIATPDGRWVDSICFHTMIGECDYQLGNIASALDQYASALKIYLQQPNWMLQIDFPANIDAMTTGVPITWGQPTRNTRVGKFPDRFMLVQDTLTASPADAKGNINLVTGKQAIPIRANEIARCTAVSVRRRRELMGLVCPRDTFTDTLLTAFSRRPAPPNNWSSCWVDVQLGLAYAASGKVTQASSELAKGLQAGGTLDHQLTSAALLELGQLALYEGKFEAAMTLFLEATYSASQFDLYDDMEEGFRYAQLCWLLQNKNSMFPALAPAIQWASAKKVRKLDVALRLLAAENATMIGETNVAAGFLASAQKSMLRTEMASVRPGARWQFEMARINFANQNFAEGAANLAVAMKFQQASSKWLFQIALANTFIMKGGVTERDADQLYSEVLRDPGVADWATDALEALTVSSTSFPESFEQWFLLALQRKEPEKAMEIADRLRRHRFYATLPLGGRLLSLRWLLEAPQESLTASGQKQRQDLLLKYPPYAQVSQQAEAIQKELAALPLLGEDDETKKKQTELFGKLAKASTAQEVLLRNIAVRRDPAEYAFPPTLNLKEMQPKIPERTLVLSFVQINGKLHGYALGRQRAMHFEPEAIPKLKADLTTIFKAWGLDEKNQLLTAKDLANTTWRSAARHLLLTLTNKMKDENWDLFDEVVIVPDSLVWYVPWEALPLNDQDDAPLLISKVRVRTVPTLSLALPDAAVKQPFDRSAIVAGKLYPRDDLAVSTTAYDQMKERFPQAAKLLSNIPAPSSLFLSQADQLVVYHDLDELSKGAYDWAPCPVDKAKAASYLSEWFALPWRGPRQVILPGFHTAAEASLRRNASGDELFLTSCAFLASGAKTVLLSRWRNGGQASYSLVREFAAESPYGAASSAWQRSVQLVMQNPLDAPLEPRLQSSEKLEDLKTDHPVFWAGYLLIDTGSMPPGSPPPAAAKPAEAVPKKPADEVKKDEAKKEEVKKEPEAKKPLEPGKVPAEVEALNPQNK
jgi:CHAT domain